MFGVLQLPQWFEFFAKWIKLVVCLDLVGSALPIEALW